MTAARGVTYLFDIQVKTFNHVYDGEDVIAQARTGTGKTFSFAIPLIEKLQSESGIAVRGRAPKVHNQHPRLHTTWMILVSTDLRMNFCTCLKVLVLTPTRELAIQVSRDFKDIVKSLSVTCFYGGSSYNPQSKSKH